MNDQDAGALLVQARQRAGLSQRQLARRARTAQSVVARIESGTSSPTWQTLQALLVAAGHDIHAKLVARPPKRSHMLNDVARILALTPEQRLLELKNAAKFYANAVRER